MEYEELISNWIWVNPVEQLDPEVAQLVCFRKTFCLKELPAALKVRVSADTRYKLYMNGSLVELGPVKGDANIWYVDVADLGQYMVQGENVLSAEVLRYPLNHEKGNYGMFRTAYPGLYVAEIVPSKLLSERGSRITSQDYVCVEEEEGYGLSAGLSWKYKVVTDFEIVSESPIFAPLKILENRKGDAAFAGWKKPYYDDSSWSAAVPYPAELISQAVSPGNLKPRTIPYMRKEQKSFSKLVTIRKSALSVEAWEGFIRNESAVVIPPFTHEIVEIGAGAETTGYLSLKMSKGNESLLKVLTAESYVLNNKNKEDCKIRKGDRCNYAEGHLFGFTDTYVIAGYGCESLPEVFEPFWFRTFRFIQLDITTGKEPLTLQGMTYIETGYPLEVKTKVQVSDQTLAPVWEISLRTLRCCMHETYEDCPFYEQLQYAMDSRTQILYTYAVSGDDRLARKCMDDFRRSQRYDGMINCSYPMTGPNVIPGFSIYYLLMLYDHMMYFGDKDFLRQHLGAIDGVLQYFHTRMDHRGLVDKNGGTNTICRFWSFIDWTPQWDENSGVPLANLYGPLTMESLLYILGLSAGAAITAYLGRKDVSDEYVGRAEAVRRSVRQYCIGVDGMLQDGPGIEQYSQHCQVFGLLSDTVTGDQARRNLLTTLEDSQTYAPCSVAMSYYLFRALEKADLYEKTNGCWDIWRTMIQENLTTCVEDNVNKRSDCHAWGSLALYELPAIVLGVHPAAPGYEKIGITPHPGYLSSASGDVITSKGMVHVSWKKTITGELELVYKAPEGVEVLVSKKDTSTICTICQI